MHFHFLALFLLLQHLPTIQNVKTFSWFPCFFLSFSLKVVIFYCSSTFTLQIFLLSVPILHHRIPSPCGDWRGEMPKIKRTKCSPYVTKHRHPAKPTKMSNCEFKQMSNHTFCSRGLPNMSRTYFLLSNSISHSGTNLFCPFPQGTSS